MFTGKKKYVHPKKSKKEKMFMCFTKDIHTFFQNKMNHQMKRKRKKNMNKKKEHAC